MGAEEKKYCYKYPHPAVATDCVVFGFDGRKLYILLIERGREPYKGRWAFPGGFLNMDETAEAGAKRELQEETGLTPSYVEQFYVCTNPDRDPRERVISIAHLALVKLQTVQGGDDAARAGWFALDAIPPLAFDHELVLHKAIERLLERFRLQPDGSWPLFREFTAEALRQIHEAVSDARLLL
ncbi:MAG: NUDIX hydrolase [Prevotellaceae bacterium]|nr:NUDIX hydrolase [Prevotellaceae bacterium]